MGADNGIKRSAMMTDKYLHYISGDDGKELVEKKMRTEGREIIALIISRVALICRERVYEACGFVVWARRAGFLRAGWRCGSNWRLGSLVRLAP